MPAVFRYYVGRAVIIDMAFITCMQHNVALSSLRTEIRFSSGKRRVYPRLHVAPCCPTDRIVTIDYVTCTLTPGIAQAVFLYVQSVAIILSICENILLTRRILFNHRLLPNSFIIKTID